MSLVFISHISEEQEIAIALKELIEESLLGMIDVFVSSDESSINVGQRWLDNITKALHKCSIEIVLCSPQSIKRPWINFEAGAGWVKEIPVVPLCHSGITPSELPIPLNMLQATSASEVSGLKLLFTVLSNEIGAKVPKIDFTDFIQKVKDFEDRYTFWNKCNDHFIKLDNYNPQILPVLKSLEPEKPLKIQINDRDVPFMEELMKFFSSNNLLELKVGGGTMIGPGIFHEYFLIPKADLPKIMSDDRFVFKERLA